MYFLIEKYTKSIDIYDDDDDVVNITLSPIKTETKKKKTQPQLLTAVRPTKLYKNPKEY